MQRINGAGNPLPAPQNLYPSELYNSAPDFGANTIDLQPGQAFALPPGDFMVTSGSYCVLQYLDPVGNYWRHVAAVRGQWQWLFNDGYTRRLANLTGCPVAAVVAGGGTSFAQATTTVTANVGGSTWQPIVGGSLGVKSITVPGSFNLPPMVLIPDPPAYAANSIGGVAATATSTLTNGTVSHVSLVDVGAGYTAATVTGYLLPNPYDPLVGTATPGTVNFTLTNAGIITAVLCTNNGASLGTPSTITLTAAGGSGSGATITPVVLQTVVSATTTSVGAGWGNVANPAKITTTGGQPASVSAIGNATVELTGYKPRDANITATTNAAGCITALTLIDGGLFVGTPGVAIIPGGTVPTTAATIALTMGGVNDSVSVQPL